MMTDEYYNIHVEYDDLIITTIGFFEPRLINRPQIKHANNQLLFLTKGNNCFLKTIRFFSELPLGKPPVMIQFVTLFKTITFQGMLRLSGISVVFYNNFLHI